MCQISRQNRKDYQEPSIDGIIKVVRTQNGLQILNVRWEIMLVRQFPPTNNFMGISNLLSIRTLRSLSTNLKKWFAKDIGSHSKCVDSFIFDFLFFCNIRDCNDHYSVYLNGLWPNGDKFIWWQVDSSFKSLALLLGTLSPTEVAPISSFSPVFRRLFFLFHSAFSLS